MVISFCSCHFGIPRGVQRVILGSFGEGRGLAEQVELRDRAHRASVLRKKGPFYSIYLEAPTLNVEIPSWWFLLAGGVSVESGGVSGGQELQARSRAPVGGGPA